MESIVLRKFFDQSGIDGLPLSDVTTLGIPKVEMTLSRTGMVAFAEYVLIPCGLLHILSLSVTLWQGNYTSENYPRNRSVQSTTAAVH